MARPKEKQEEEKKETGKKYLPVQSSAGTKGQTAQERAKEILSMSREEQKARNQARLREALNRSAQSRPASSAQTEAMRRNFTKREQKEEYRRRYGTPQSSREAREQYQWNKRQREAFEQYQSYFEKYGQKPTEEQVQNNPVLSDIGQLWKANTTQAQATQKALEEIENTRIPGQAGRKLWMAAQNANTIAPLEQARARELPQLSQEDQAFVDNARKRLEELYPQRDALEAKGDAEGLAEVNRLIANEEKVMRDRGVALPGEAAEIADKYALGGSKDLEAYLEAKRNVELMDEEIALGGVIAPEENKKYQELKARVESGEELTGQDVYDYKVWSEQYGAYERDKETIKTLEEAGVTESGYSYAAQDRQRVNEGQLTQVEELSQYAGTMQAPIARQEASKLLTELYNEQYELQKDIAAMELAGITGPAMDNAKDQLETVERQITEGEYAMLRFEDDFFTNVQPGAGAGKKGSVYHVVNATEEELAKLRARGVGQSVMPVRSGVADAIAGLSGQELNALRMTDMERQTYNYLHNTQGAEAADAYFKSLEPRLLKRQAEMQQGVWQTIAEHPVGAFTTTAATFPMTLVEGLGAVKTGVDTMLGRETSPYDSAFAPTRFKSTVRETVKAGQREAFGEGLGGDIANLAYDVVTTSLDSALSMAAGGATGGSALMALSATSGKTQQELLLGRDNSRALVQGLAAGVTEYITEKLGMDRLTAAFSLGKKGGYRTILANMIKGFAPEALEELPGNVVDQALDNYLNGDSSQRAESIKQKIAAGMSATQATVETDMEFVVETLQGMLVGGLSGSLGAGVSTSVGMIKARSARTALTEAGVDADTAQAAAERISGLRSDVASEQAVRAAVEQIQQAEDAKGVKHTPFAAEATAAGYEDVPVKVTGFQGIRDGAAWVEIEIAGKGKGEIRLDQVRFADTDTQTAYNRAAMFGDTQTARRFLAGYEATSMPMEIYGQAFQSAYQAGQNSRAMTEYERKAGFGAMLEDGVYRIAYQAGQEATAAQEARLEIPASLGKEVQAQLGQLPRTYTEGYTGVVYAAKTTRPTKAQAVMLSLLDGYAKAHGVHYTVVDSIGDGGANGVFTTSEGMVVALDAEEGYLTRVATHEGWHYIREHMGQEAQGLQDAVLTLLRSTEGYDLETRVAEKQEQYKRIKGQELSREAALEELTADALYDAIATPEALGAFVSRAYENAENKNAFKQAMDQVMAFINRFVAEVKALAKKIAGKNPEARAMLEHEADWGESIIQEYNRLMEEAGKREQSTKQNKKGYGQDSQFYSDVLSKDVLKALGVEERSESELTQRLRYSLRNVDTDMTEMQRVVEENEKLREAVGVLRAAMKQLSGAKAVNSRQVWKFAREIKKKYESKVRVNDLGENLRRVYDAMANARTDAEGKSAMEAMAAIARNMLENSEHINRDMYDRYADMRDYLRRGRFQLTEAQWAEAEKLYGSLKEFRNEVKGRWGVAGRKDHSTGSLDAAWEDMHAKWPEMFDRNADERGKVQQVVAALEAVQKEVSNPYGMNLDQMTQTVTAELFEGFGQVNEANALMEEAKAIARRKTTRWAINREKLAEQRKARAEVIRQKGRILKKLNSPKSGSFVPYQMREAVTALLKALDYNEGKGVTIKREMLERARQEYEAVLPKRDANGSAVPDTGIPALAAFYNGDVAEAMQRLAQSADGKQLNRLSQEETIELRDILRSYAAMIINEDRLFMQKRQDSLQEAGDGLVARMLQRKAHKQRGKAAETVLNVTNRALLSPGTVFHIFEGTEMEPIWKAVRDAENTHTRHVAQGQAYMEAALKEYGVQEIINQSERKQLENGVEVTLHDGKKQKFRIQEAMYIYAAAKREKLVGTNHLLGGGIVFQKNSHPGEATGARQLTAEDLEAIAGKLTEKQKAFVDHMVQFLSRDTAEWGNQVTRELYGVEKFKESYYVPFKVARNYLRTDPASQQENRLKLGSFTKPLAQQASNPLEVQNFVEMWAAHMEQMSDYNAFVLPIEDMTRLMNYKTDNDTVRSVMQERYGNQVPDYILSFLRRLNGNAKSEMGSALVNKLVSGAKGAAVGGNLSVASQQATAVLRAYALIDAKYLVKGMGAGALSAAKMKKSYAEIMDWAPIATQKSWGYFDTNMTRGTYDRARQTAMGKLDDALGYLSQKGDELAFTMIWEAVKREVAAESGLTRGTEAYFRRCGERFTEVIDQTQVVDSIFQRTELATEKGLARLWTSFMSEPFKQYNMLWRAGWDLKEAWRSGNKAAIKRARNQMIRTSASVVLSSVAAAAAKSLISAMRDDDDEKKEKDENGKTVTVGVRGFGEKYWDAFGPNLMDNATGLLPLVGNWLGSFITGETYNSSMDSALLDSITRMWQALGKGDYEMAWYRGLQVVSNATGLGLGNAYRDGKALFTTLVKTLQRDTLAGTAWDKSKPFATRLQAATKNYVYAKQEGDSRRASPAVFYDLLLDAWYAGGTGEEFQQVATAMLETGATVDGIASGFKSRLRGSEELVTKAADAYEQGKYSEYEKHVLALVRLGIGQKAAVSMVDSVLDSRKKATEEPEAQTWEMLLDELTDDDADLFSTKDLLEAIQRGDQAEADYLLGRLKESKEESTIRSGLTEAYRKEYVAAWEKGDTAAMKKISDLLLGLDVGYTEESIAKWPRDEMNADYRDAMESGDAGQVRTVIAAMKKEGYTDSDLRSKLTQDYKASYTQAWNAGNKTQAQSIATMLKGLAVGYTEDSFKEWRVDSLKADWDAAVEARDVNRLKTQITRQMEAGVNQKQIRDKVWNAYGEAYVMALAEGNTSTARQLAGLMLNTGAGLTTEEIPQKAVNKAHSIYENSVESGDLNTARQVLKYLNQAEDGDRLWDKLYNWAKDAFMDAYDSGEYADLEKNLVSMGFSQKTINGWKD